MQGQERQGIMAAIREMMARRGQGAQGVQGVQGMDGGMVGGMPGGGVLGGGMNGGGVPGGGMQGGILTVGNDGGTADGYQAYGKKVTLDRIKKANETLRKYKQGKLMLEERLKANEQWWTRRSWDYMQEQGNPFRAKRNTGWLVNVIMGKHADTMEAYPEPVILPREKGDEEEAKKLTSIIPVVLEQNDFEHVYNVQAWEKNKHGTGAYAVYWDSKKINGIGDISITGIDLMNLYWEPGIDDIQKSRNVFLVCLQDKEVLLSEYPQLQDKNITSEFTAQKYQTEDNIDTSDKALVIDWYYHTYAGGKKLLQYCKYVGTEVLYASEDDENLQGKGWYDDGDYPFVLDPLFIQKGTIAGTGYIDVGKNAQESIDLLDSAIITNAMAGAIPRYLVGEDSDINEEEFLDFTTPFIHVQGQMNQDHYMPIVTRPLGGVYVSVLNNKIEELKQTCSNQDVSNGITSGVTAASGIAAQMEAAGKASRDSNKGTYRAYSKILDMVIERIRQFYDVPRVFRIMGDNAKTEFVNYDNSMIKPMSNAPIAGMDMGMRMPVFDIHVSAQRQNAYSKMANNELALQLLNAGVFNPQLVDQSTMLLNMMDFPKKEELMQSLQNMGGMMQQMAMWQQMALTLAQKYEPGTAAKMAAGIMGQEQAQGATPIPQVDEMAMEEKTEEPKHMRDARKMQRESTQV